MSTLSLHQIHCVCMPPGQNIASNFQSSKFKEATYFS